MLEYEAVDPNRLIGLAVLPPIDDEGEGEKELRRIALLGLRGAYLAVAPNGLPLSHPSAAGLWGSSRGPRHPDQPACGEQVRRVASACPVSPVRQPIRFLESANRFSRP